MGGTGDGAAEQAGRKDGQLFKHTD
jgi:hypothetical protein